MYMRVKYICDMYFCDVFMYMHVMCTCEYNVCIWDIHEYIYGYGRAMPALTCPLEHCSLQRRHWKRMNAPWQVKGQGMAPAAHPCVPGPKTPTGGSLIYSMIMETKVTHCIQGLQSP